MGKGERTRAAATVVHKAGQCPGGLGVSSEAPQAPLPHSGPVAKPVGAGSEPLPRWTVKELP